MPPDSAIAALKTVIDPEIGLDVWTLGFIYDLKPADDGKSVDIRMTLTSPLCPFGGALMTQVKTALKKAGFEKVNLELTFDPPWEPSADLRKMLGV